MTDLKKWVPFRFTRGRHRASDVPARDGGNGATALSTLRDEMSRMMDRFWNDPFAALESRDRWFGDFSAAEFQPRLDVTDDKNALRVSIEAPGVDPKDIDVEVQDGVLTVTGEKKQETSGEDEGCYHTERSYGWFRRAVPLPTEVDAAKAEAKFDKGVLVVRMPKTERAKQQTTKIAVKV